jgi:VWFA-related protein
MAVMRLPGGRAWGAAAVVCVLGAVVLTAQQAPAPTPASAPPQGQLTFRAEANFIEVDAIVTDAQGRFVRDLVASDFEVLENKKPQTVDVFSLVDIPLERADKPLYRAEPVAADVVTNERAFDGRIWVLVLDSHHVPPTDTYKVKRVARQFVEKYMGANDLAAVIHSQTGRREDNQEFTSNKAVLLASIDKFIGEQTSSRAQRIMDDAPQRESAAEARDPEANVRAANAVQLERLKADLTKNTINLPLFWFSISEMKLWDGSTSGTF